MILLFSLSLSLSLSLSSVFHVKRRYRSCECRQKKPKALPGICRKQSQIRFFHGAVKASGRKGTGLTPCLADRRSRVQTSLREAKIKLLGEGDKSQSKIKLNY
jgi:hypothetical protein